MPKQKNKYLQLKPEDLKRIEEKQSIKEANKIDDEWVALAEFGFMFGWEAIKDIDRNVISKSAFMMLLRAGRKVMAIRRFDNTESMFLANVSSQSKESVKTFKKLTDKMLKEANEA